MRSGACASALTLRGVSSGKGVPVTFSLAHIQVADDENVTACVVRQEDGAYLPLHDASLLMELRDADSDGYALVMGVVKKILAVSNGRLTA